MDAVSRNGALTLTANRSSKAASDSSCVRPPGNTPALLTRTSMSPASAARSRTSPAEARSACTNVALPPAASVEDSVAPGMSLDDVRARTGASRSQLYHYFENRDDLVRAMIDTTTDALIDVQGDLLEHLDSWAGIERWFDALVELQGER